MYSYAFDWVQTFLTTTSQLTLLTLAKQKQKSFEEAKGCNRRYKYHMFIKLNQLGNQLTASAVDEQKFTKPKGIS